MRNITRLSIYELFRNGDYCVSTNGVVVEQYIRGNPHPDVPIGQDDDYREWVDEQVGVGLENGLYKFTASFPVDPAAARLSAVLVDMEGTRGKRNISGRKCRVSCSSRGRFRLSESSG